MVRFSVLSKARKEGGGGAKPASSSSSSSPLLCLLLLLGWGEGQIAPTSCVILRSCSDPLYLKVSISALMRFYDGYSPWSIAKCLQSDFLVKMKTSHEASIYLSSYTIGHVTVRDYKTL
ncbi:uncharacterized protein LOC107983057 isoform X6 [Anolis carolinensis]|uniref:uncharacterized protein LOC107983057 isoform X6 n=1 Tax=Anolis carolinensis TaxID=28377 RepID=UPI002F2B4EF2